MSALVVVPSVVSIDKVYESILRSGAAGLTDQEISIGWSLPGRSVRRQRHALLRTGHIVPARFRRPTVSGRKATVWLSAKTAAKLWSNLG